MNSWALPRTRRRAGRIAGSAPARTSSGGHRSIRVIAAFVVGSGVELPANRTPRVEQEEHHG
ncbi:hypothetical protein [Nocardia sp. NBC_00416]|uniref:hypothetical protein n=1 Tax=Nocardia sp. NBC_00416 TaxID=2975991 RepID=UPI002E1E497C